MPNDALIYDTPILYGHHMDDEFQNKFKKFYGSMFLKYEISTIHDCSIGAGGSTLPLAKLGHPVSGSDLSENLLNKAKINFSENGFSPKLFIGDFLDEKIDCIISTGNSLLHVDLNGFDAFLKSTYMLFPLRYIFHCLKRIYPNACQKTVIQ